MKKRVLMVMLLLAVVLACSAGASAVTMDWVKVEDAGNAGEQSRLTSHGDPTYYGGVDYEYYIGKYEVTNNQYCEFLNAVDPNGSNIYGLYNPDMSGPYGGILFYSKAPKGSKYLVRTGLGNNPVNFVSWCDALRFANWMHNGQGRGSTETGAYEDMDLDYLARRRRVARVFLPNEDEWYKAAYYKGGGLDAGYWDYATANDSCPISEAPPGGNNSANYYGTGGYAVGGHHISDVGAYVNSGSAYGTFDQNGNLWEWTETNWEGYPYFLVIRGGSFSSIAVRLAAPYRNFSPDSTEATALGFRVASIPEPKIYYVDADSPYGGDGRSWATAFKHLQDAITAVRPLHVPVEIRVAKGTYKPDQGVEITPGDRTATFQLITGVTIKGGYAGFNQPNPNARDIEAYKTILSGDLDGNDVNDPWELWNELNRAENSFHVVTIYGTDETAVLDGFTITGGNANECPFKPQVPDPNNVGGGIYNYAAGPTLTNCTLIGNSAWYGGGMYNYGSYIPASPILNNCIFSRNIAGSSGGGLFSYGGFRHPARPMLSNCTFTGNSAPNGSAIVCDSREDSYWYSSDIQLTNCILWNDGNEIWNNDGSTITIRYTDLQSDQMGIYDPCGGVVWGAGNIDVDPCFAEPGYWDPNGTPDDANDDFWVDGDYHLKSQAGRWEPNTQTWVQDDVTSLCIDAGDPAIPIGYEPFPNGGIINMGAYGGTAEASKSYFRKPVCETIVAGDINGDCLINFKDFAFMALHWLEDNNP